MEEDGHLPPMQGLSINNTARGIKRSGGPPGAEREGEARLRKSQFLCNAPWSVMLEEAIETFGPLLYKHCERDHADTAEVKYEHSFCWRNKVTGEMHDGMTFIVYARRIVGQQAFLFRPGLKSDDGSQNHMLWYVMKTELGNAGLLQRVECSDDPARLRVALAAFLGPWLRFFARKFPSA